MGRIQVCSENGVTAWEAYFSDLLLNSARIRLAHNILLKCSGAQRAGDTPTLRHPSMTRAA